MKYIAYCRKSTDEPDRQILSIEAQAAELEEHAAKENKLSFIDLYDYFTKKNYKKLLSDGLHPNTEGHEVIYTKVLSKLKSLDILK
jgi:lysophospholipase L1-like esterase